MNSFSVEVNNCVECADYFESAILGGAYCNHPDSMVLPHKGLIHSFSPVLTAMMTTANYDHISIPDWCPRLKKNMQV